MSSLKTDQRTTGEAASNLRGTARQERDGSYPCPKSGPDGLKRNPTAPTGESSSNGSAPMAASLSSLMFAVAIFLRNRGVAMGLRERSDRQPCTPLRSTARQHLAAILGAHALAEAVFSFPFQIRWLPKRKGHARLLHTLIAIQRGGIRWAVSTRVNLRSAQREFGNAGECDSAPRVKLLLRMQG